MGNILSKFVECCCCCCAPCIKSQCNILDDDGDGVGANSLDP